MDNYIKQFNDFVTSIRNYKDFECDGNDFTDMSRCIVEWLRNNPDPQIIAKAFEVESKHYLELSNYLDTGMDMTPDEYVEYIIKHWNDEETDNTQS